MDWKMCIKVGGEWYTADKLLKLAADRHIILSDEQEKFVDKYRSKGTYWKYL